MLIWACRPNETTITQWIKACLVQWFWLFYRFFLRITLQNISNFDNLSIFINRYPWITKFCCIHDTLVRSWSMLWGINCTQKLKALALESMLVMNWTHPAVTKLRVTCMLIVSTWFWELIWTVLHFKMGFRGLRDGHRQHWGRSSTTWPRVCQIYGQLQGYCVPAFQRRSVGCCCHSSQQG